MRYLSTRGSAPAATFSQAVEQGLAADGGLYVPESLPVFEPTGFSPGDPIARTAAAMLAPFFETDPLAPSLPEICSEALSFPIPLRRIDPGTSVLELFHGPTAAFKDVGARFLASCFARMPAAGARRRTILAATSGDTGGAVAAAFHRKPGIEVAILFPEHGVSPLQKHQLTCWGDNVLSLAVRGSFDDCQRLVKDAFARRSRPEAWPGRHLTSANSINIGRILPQAVYYAHAGLEYLREHGVAPGFVVPSGNLGNAMAALWAMKMGFPVREVLMATNANRVVPDYFASGVFKAAASVKTLANAMDVGDPSNFERLLHAWPELRELRARCSSVSVGDDEIRRTIREGQARYGRIWCPHTATAVRAREAIASPHWVVVATAHPAKFNDVLAPLLGREAPMPPALERLMGLPSRFGTIDAAPEALRAALD